MPTARPRHLVTETDDLTDAIDAAAPLFPGETRAAVLRRLALLGAETVAEHREERSRLVRSLAGRYPGMYPTGHLEALREEWPA